jgi:hypothetical protein
MGPDYKSRGFEEEVFPPHPLPVKNGLQPAKEAQKHFFVVRQHPKPPEISPHRVSIDPTTLSPQPHALPSQSSWPRDFALETIEGSR